MKMFFRPLVGACLLVLLGLGAAGCSKSDSALNPVQGKVIHKGQPLEGALVTLHPKAKSDFTAVPSTGLTKADGTFTVTTGTKDGAPAGEYVVTIICSKVPAGAKPSLSTGGVETQDVLDGAYAIKEGSKINVTVKDGPNQLEPFDLK